MSYPNLSALLEAIIYLAKEPVSIDTIHKALPEVDRVELQQALQTLIEGFRASERGIEIREVADGVRFSTKPEHHEVLKKFIRNQIPPTRLSLPALETLAVIAYKQPVTIPEIQEIRGVQASGVIKTLLDKKFIANAGRKEVLGRPKFGLPAALLTRWFALLDAVTTQVIVDQPIEFPRDRKDAIFIACAIAARADYLITGDRDFIEARKLLTTTIVSVSQFKRLVCAELP